MEISLNDLKELLQTNKPCCDSMSTIQPNGDCYIVVMTNGFIYVGNTTVEGNFIKMTKASNIRIWGTTKSLSELVDGPPDSTKHDKLSTEIIVPLNAVIHFIKCQKNHTW